jgi:hypothetical protein
VDFGLASPPRTAPWPLRDNPTLHWRVNFVPGAAVTVSGPGELVSTQFVGPVSVCPVVVGDQCAPELHRDYVYVLTVWLNGRSVESRPATLRVDEPTPTTATVPPGSGTPAG